MGSLAPKRIKLHKQSQTLELDFDSESYLLGAEYLRVFSPSAEVKGHGPGQEILQLNKSKVKITGIEAQGNYALRLIFDDGHNSGIYTWEYLHGLAKNHESNWQNYCRRVEQHKADEGLTAVKWVDPS